MPGGYCPTVGALSPSAVLWELIVAWALPFPAQGRLVVGAAGTGGAEPEGVSSAPQALRLFPSVLGGLAPVLEPSAARAA